MTDEHTALVVHVSSIVLRILPVPAHLNSIGILVAGLLCAIARHRWDSEISV